jgi:hypothetical protein
VVKNRRRNVVRRSSPPRARRDQVSRQEYADLCLRFSFLEMQANRNRIDLDIQLTRIAQLQDEIEILKQRHTGAVTTEIPTLALSPKPTVES